MIRSISQNEKTKEGKAVSVQQAINYHRQVEKTGKPHMSIDDIFGTMSPEKQI